MAITTKSYGNDRNKQTHVILKGAGIMSATLGILLKELEPGITIDVFERSDMAAAEAPMPGTMPEQVTRLFVN